MTEIEEAADGRGHTESTKRDSSGGTEPDEDSGIEPSEEVSDDESESTSSEDASSDDDDVSDDKDPSDHQPDLKSRIAAFLPQLAEANQNLSEPKRIDDVGADERHYIEMNLGLGVLTEKDEIQAHSESTDDENDDKVSKPAGKKRKIEEVE